MALTHVKSRDSVRNVAGKAQVYRGDGGVNPSYQLGATNGIHVAVIEYSFADDGAIPVTTNALGTGIVLPANAIVIGSWMRTVVQVTGSTNIGATAFDDFDIFPSTAAPAAGAITAGVARATPASFKLGNANSNTAAREILLTATGAISTLGKFVLYVEWMETIHA